MRLELIPWGDPKAPDATEIRRRLETDGYDAFQWHDPPGATYEPHSHDRDEVLWLIAGEITFGAAGRDFALRPGDRLMLPKGTVHTAHAGTEGATYWIGERSENAHR
jgi:quercetin dioxygenase-like cupin family protein